MRLVSANLGQFLRSCTSFPYVENPICDDTSMPEHLSSPRPRRLTDTQTDPTLKELDSRSSLPVALAPATLPATAVVVVVVVAAAAAAATTSELPPGHDEPYTE